MLKKCFNFSAYGSHEASGTYLRSTWGEGMYTKSYDARRSSTCARDTGQWIARYLKGCCAGAPKWFDSYGSGGGFAAIIFVCNKVRGLLWQLAQRRVFFGGLLYKRAHH